MLSSPDKIKDYEVIAPLGAGGMATLYLARRRGVGGFSRLVTLKLVHKHLVQDEAMVERFLDEARISAHVAHPNVVHVEEVARLGDSYFIAMEYVHGVSLAELMERLVTRGARMRPTLCVWLAAQVAEALQAAHEARGENGAPLGIVHHDVSPQNVLIAHTGHVKLIDFGIARCCAPGETSATDSVLLGKLRYMSPEQLRLESVDRKTDVYALGVMLWEMLVGRSLLRGHHVDDERDWNVRREPPPPSRYAPHCMPWLDKVVLKALACDPEQRYASALELRRALLEADPSAVRLDAPLVARLLRTLIGDELDRRRAGWPQEVAGELEIAQDRQTPPPGLIHGAGMFDEDDELEPTQAGVGGARADWEQSLSALYERVAALGSLPARLSVACATVRAWPCARLNVACVTVRGWPCARRAGAVGRRWWAAQRLQLRRSWLQLRPRLQAELVWALRVLQRQRVALVGVVCLALGLWLGQRLSRRVSPALPPMAAQAYARPVATPVWLGAVTSCPRSDPTLAPPPRVSEDAGLLAAVREEEPRPSLRRSAKLRASGRTFNGRKLKRAQHSVD